MATEPQPIPEGPRAGIPRGEQAASISREMVKLLRHISGRGPTKARTTLGRDHVLVMFEDSLSEGERTLVYAGIATTSRRSAAPIKHVMEAEASAMVTEVTGRKVARFMSANHLDPPDAAAEVFLFEPDGAATTRPRRLSTSWSPQSASEPSGLGLWPVASN